MPRNYIRVDIDGMIITTNGGPKALIEIKRLTKIPVEKWEPYKEDVRNYYIYSSLCKLLGIEFYTINHSVLNAELTKDTRIGIYKINDVQIEPPKIENQRAIRNLSILVPYFKDKYNL